MLTSLSISNYALIDHLQVNFDKDLSVITGETGAGKSILLGALGLILGNRADLSSLKDTSKKCIVEGRFTIENYKLNDFFQAEDLDYEPHTIIRRELLPSGKSRAFVNDTPVNLSTLQSLQSKLIDVHSQHQTMKLSSMSFQFQLIDALAQNGELLEKYSQLLEAYKQGVASLNVLETTQLESQQQYDYNIHLLEELQSANLEQTDQETLELLVEKGNNLEEIGTALSGSAQTAKNEDVGTFATLQMMCQKTGTIAQFDTAYEKLASRIESIKIELEDIVQELESAYEQLEFNETDVAIANDRLQLLYTLQKKHNVTTVDALIQIQQELQEKTDLVDNAAALISQQKAEVDRLTDELDTVAIQVRDHRTTAIPLLKEKLEAILKLLGMEQTVFEIRLSPAATFQSNGKDALQFLVSTNKGLAFDQLRKVASGGELSRIMLAAKLTLSQYIELPTIIFDEIDTGVSGEVSTKIAELMAFMGKNMQVITITHLPQIAARGKQHYKVYKQTSSNTTVTTVKELNYDERIAELAEMLSGKQKSETAIEHAKELLSVNT